MRRQDAAGATSCNDGLTRREFLQATAVPLAGLALPALSPSEGWAARKERDVNCIMIVMLGGPSQIDTWDPKPEAASEVRGPFRPIETNVSGIRISELFPRMAKLADQYALVRSVYHTAPAIHDVGHQLIQTGRLSEDGIEHPHPGSVLAKLRGARSGSPAHVVLPTPLRATGANLSHGQGAGYLGAEFEPLALDADPSRPGARAADLLPRRYLTADRTEQRRGLRDVIDAASEETERQVLDLAQPWLGSAAEGAAFELNQEPNARRERYGMNKFGQSCLLARRLVERGTRFVTINMFETVFNETTWDAHGTRPFSTLQSYRDLAGPWFDHGYSSLLEDLTARGMLENTLVVCVSEFGRTPRLNPAGGRDHWTHCWSMAFAGGGVKGGQVIGASDDTGAYPKERPVAAPEVAATVYHALGVNPYQHFAGPDGQALALVDYHVKPILELF